jgi:outer membrane protein TolC
MANRHRSSAILALVLASAGPARADRTLTIDDALALARTHNRDLRAARERVAEANAGVEQARAALLPTVAARGKYTHNYRGIDFDVNALLQPAFDVAQAVRDTTNLVNQMAAIDAAVARDQAQLKSQPALVILKEEELDGDVSASVPVVAPPLYYALSAARAVRDASGAGYQVTEADVLVAVAQSYFAAAGTDELVVARHGAVKVATETFDVAKARVAAELANQVESTRAETALVRAEQDLAEAENAKAAAYRALATLIGVHDPIAVQAAPALPAEPGAFEALVGQARAHRPDLAVARATIVAAEASARASAWRWAPTLSAFGFLHGQNYAGFTLDKYAWGLGLQLDWLVFDGGVRDAQRHVAEAQGRAAEARLELLADRVSDEVANARGSLETKRKGVAAAERSVALARETLRLVRAQYEAGTVKQLDVLQAQDALAGAEIALAQAHFDVALADLQLRRAAGEFPGRAR